ncbi:MAG TPA: type II toxin-antitoxin system HicB family antitoxin [Longimicrobiaceae bacterium]
MMTKYEVIIFWSAEDQLFLAQVPELPGCIAHGDSREEALRNVEDAIDLWLEVAKRRGRPIPEPGSRPVLAAQSA